MWLFSSFDDKDCYALQNVPEKQYSFSQLRNPLMSLCSSFTSRRKVKSFVLLHVDIRA